MNAMAVFKHPDGSRSFLLSLLSQPLTSHGSAVELATAPLDGMILPGVTRDSVLSLAREHASGKAKIEGLPHKFLVSEREIPMKEVQEAAKAGTLVEFFGTGQYSSSNGQLYISP